MLLVNMFTFAVEITTKEAPQAVYNLFSALIELHCRGVIMVRLAADSCNRKIEELSWFEHELSEATSSLKSALDQVLANDSRAVWPEAELELNNTRYTELMALQEVEKKRMAELEKAMEELKLDNSTLQANKASLKDELST